LFYYPTLLRAGNSHSGRAQTEVNMSNQVYAKGGKSFRLPRFSVDRQRKIFIGIVLLLALLAFEVFNFDTTQFALQSLLGDARFVGILWATILAIAFCSIDFAGLVRLFTPERSSGTNKEGWYLMGAWLLGATMNAVMTWWAVSLTLLNNNFGNEVLSREQLLRYVPIFVAVLVWLTRILFIGAFSIAGEQLFENKPAARGGGKRRAQSQSSSSSSRGRKTTPSRLRAAPKPAPKPQPTAESVAEPFADLDVAPSASQPAASSPTPRPSRVRQRPPVPNSRMRRTGSNLQARGRS
jgi:hypothetical protein